MANCIFTFGRKPKLSPSKEKTTMKSSLLFLCSIVFPIFPDTRCFGIKRALLRLAGAKVGKNVRICSSVRIKGTSKLLIGDNTWIGHNCLIVCSSNITIGSNVDIAPMCYIGTGTHEITPRSNKIAGNGYSLPIKIADGCWLCVRSTILPGTQIDKKCIVAAGAVVKGSYKSLSLIGGIPAKVIRTL